MNPGIHILGSRFRVHAFCELKLSTGEALQSEGVHVLQICFLLSTMVQSYFRHGPTQVSSIVVLLYIKYYLNNTQAFGLVCSGSSNSVYDGKLAYVPALEDVLVWNVKKGQMVSVRHPSTSFDLIRWQLAMWHETGHRAEVTSILRSPQADLFAVGYADGSIKLWSASAESVLTTFNGHKKAVTALAFDERGTKLASGSQDTDLIVWDVVAEAGLYRWVV